MAPQFPTPPPDVRKHWSLDPDVVFLNHGSFGACPNVVLAKQGEWRARMEREPVLFLGRQLEGLLDDVRAVLGKFVHCDPDDLAFVNNATTGVNTVLRSLVWKPGDELLITNHEYAACRNAALAIAERTGVKVVVADVPWPLTHEDQVVEAVVGAVTPRTRLALVDHVTSQSGLVFPIEEIVRALDRKGVDVLVDGAHAIGMLPLNLEHLGAAYYTTNAHKWLCAPKGAALLHVRKDRQKELLPLVVSHGFRSSRTDRTPFRLRFDWNGTDDPTPWLCMPNCIEFLGGLLPGGLAALQRHNRQTALAARAVLCDALAVRPPSPETMIGSLVSLPLPGSAASEPQPSLGLHPLQAALFERHRVEVPVMTWPRPGAWQLRVSAQVYNREGDYRTAATAVQQELAQAGRTSL